ncbi:hypothetical protein L3i22_060800 [Actinoplanes sp. L3-i22]|nr:hypothetical protein L3i22_060800 [Actinoplanes sp. L3-i22]
MEQPAVCAFFGTGFGADDCAGVYDGANTDAAEDNCPACADFERTLLRPIPPGSSSART